MPSRRPAPQTDDEANAQPALIKLTDAEKLEAAEKLADLWRARRRLKAEHDAQRKEMKEEADALDRDIDALASIVRSGGR